MFSRKRWRLNRVFLASFFLVAFIGVGLPLAGQAQVDFQQMLKRDITAKKKTLNKKQILFAEKYFSEAPLSVQDLKSLSSLSARDLHQNPSLRLMWIDLALDQGITQYAVEELVSYLHGTKQSKPEFQKILSDHFAEKVKSILSSDTVFLSPSMKSQIRQLKSRTPLTDGLANWVKRESVSSLARARRAFQKGQFAESKKFYEKIPLESPLFLKTQKELAWTYYHLDEEASLQGLLLHLNTPLVPFEYRMEGRVLAGMMSLKNCDYAKVKEEIQDFQSEAKAFQQKLSLSKKTPLALTNKIDELQLLRQSLVEQMAQVKSLKWTHLEEGRAQSALRNIEEQIRQTESRVIAVQRERFDEAILKMRFLRLEFLTQLKLLEIEKGNSLSKSEEQSEQWKRDSLAAHTEKLKASEKSKMVFKMDKDIWADEFFQAKLVSENLCSVRE